MMQQTTYGTVLPYYKRFLARFPTVVALAQANEEDVLKAWEGLGYYARARNLLATARRIVCGKKPVWPSSSAEWAKMPGIGPYTAAALSSVLNGERVPVVDGNVARVFSRYWQLKDNFSTSPAREKLAERLLPEIARSEVPGDFNQAMMELGALVCSPNNPDCRKCPLNGSCKGFLNGSWADYPVKPMKKPLPVRKVSAVVVKDAQGRVLLVQNREAALLKGLWELPTILPGEKVTQVFSHFKLELSTYEANQGNAEFRDPSTVPLATATRKILIGSGILAGKGA